MNRIFIAAGLFTLVFSSNLWATNKYYGANLCGYPGFECIEVKKGDTWESLFPNEKDREIVKRLNRTNIGLRYRAWIVVPKDLSDINHLDLSPFPPHKDTHGKKLIYVSIHQQAFGAYNEKGDLIHWGPISAGRDYCPDVARSCKTATGNYRIFRKQGEDCESSKFPVETNGGAPMPYCMHYYKGFALHGSTLPGYNGSHGCIRLFFDDAEWLNKDFADIGTPITVTN